MNQNLTPRKLNTADKIGNPFFHPSDDYLLKFIKNSSYIDPSMNSLGYIQMTSRKGLSCFSGQFSDILFSLHPNDNQKYIIYPPAEQSGYFDIRELAETLKLSGKNIEIIRVPEESSIYAASIIGGKRTLDTDLDYAYPVHVVDTHALNSMYGTKYHKFRNKVNAAKKEGTIVRKTDFNPNDLKSIRSVINNWAPELFGTNHIEQTSYIDFVLDKLIPQTNIKGLISEKKGTPNGFTIWEEPINNYDTANSLIHSSIHERGISELLHHEMAKHLNHMHIPKLSLGGAESKGLDEFKRKMNPSQSIKLETIIY